LAKFRRWRCDGGETITMKILMAQDTFLPKLGGAEVHVWKLSKVLSARGHQVTIITATPGRSVIDGINVYRFPLLQSQGKQAIISLSLYLPKLVTLVKAHDIVHGHYTAFCSATLGIVAKFLCRPFVVTLHGFGTLESSVAGNIWLRSWRRISFVVADKVIATSSELQRVAQRFVRPERVVVIPNGIDTQFFTPFANSIDDSIIRVVTVRRLVPKNGVQYLLEAAPFILQQSPRPVEFWIVGDGRLRQYLETRACELGISSKVRFWGEVHNDQVRQILSQAHITVFPSSAESTSIAALEAMAMGKAVVASEVGGYPELLGENERGLLVKLFDCPESNYDAPLNLATERICLLADAVVRLIKYPELRTTLSSRAREYVCQRFDWHIIAEQVERIYAEVLGEL
jgi:glycosyltransferase involved in cell wall biosynthesis